MPVSSKKLSTSGIVLIVVAGAYFAIPAMADEACPPQTVRLKSDMGTETCVDQRMANYISCLERVPRRTLSRDDGTKVNVNLSAAAQGKLKLLPVGASGDANVAVEVNDLLLKEFGSFKDASSEIEAIKGCAYFASERAPQIKKRSPGPKPSAPKTLPSSANSAPAEKTPPSEKAPAAQGTDSVTRRVNIEGARFGDKAELSGGNCEGATCTPVEVDVKSVECGNGCKIELGNQKSD